MARSFRPPGFFERLRLAGWLADFDGVGTGGNTPPPLFFFITVGYGIPQLLLRTEICASSDISHAIFWVFER